MRLSLAVLFFGLLPASVFAQNPSNPQRATFAVVNNAGFQKVIPFASITLCAFNVQNQCNSTVTIFSNPALTSPIGYPFTADANGYFSYYVAGGSYIERQCFPAGGCLYYSLSLVGPGGGSSGVTSLNSLVGAVTIASGAGISVAVSGSTITISAAADFSITSFTGGQSGELGQSFTNPAFSATYSITPASAQITNTDGTDSPHVLTTPFTSGTITGTFTHSTVTTTTFTLSATQGTTQTATQTITWNPRIFGGVGSPGATSTVTASGTTAHLSTGDVLASIQLGGETVGQTLGTYTPSGQAVYLLLTGGSHTFVDTGTGFPMAFNSPTSVSFINQFGTTVSMFLYQSTNPLTGSFTPKVAS